MVLHLPGVIDAEPVGQLDLGQRVLEELELGPVFPGPRQLVLVEDPESHRQLLSCQRSAPRPGGADGWNIITAPAHLPVLSVRS